jgi:hypothetical protein
MSESSIANQIRNFGMRNLQLESDLERIESSGIDIGHATTIKKKEVVDPELFEADIRQSAKKMITYYSLFFSFENSLRRLIRQTLTEKYGNEWWKKSS